MKIDTYEKLFLGLTVVALACFMGALAAAVNRHGISLPHPTARVDPAALRAAPPAPFDQLGLVDKGGGAYDLNLLAAMWQYEPFFPDKMEEGVHVPAGATVTFNVSSPDVIHGFKIKDTNVNIMVIPGQVSTVTHTFDAPGEYTVLCHEYCGAGHHRMYLKLHVDPPAAAAGDARQAGGES